MPRFPRRNGDTSGHTCEAETSRLQHIVREGHAAPCIHFIVSGLVRLYYNRDGRELVRGFDYEGRWVTAYESVLTGNPAQFSIETLEPTHTLSFTADTLRSTYDRHACWDRFGGFSRRNGFVNLTKTVVSGSIRPKSTIAY